MLTPVLCLRDAFDQDPDVASLPTPAGGQENCSLAQMKSEEKLAERVEDVEMI